MNAADMINRCFRHQHPEAYDLPPAAEAVVPTELRYGPGDSYPMGPAVAEEPMGHPDASAW